MKPSELKWKDGCSTWYESQRIVRAADNYRCSVYRHRETGEFDIVGPGSRNEDRLGLNAFELLAELTGYEPLETTT